VRANIHVALVAGGGNVTVFLVLGALGVVLLLVALVLGDVLDGALEGLSAGFFSTEALAGFLGALGFGGAIALDATGSTSLAVVIGLVLGALLGAAAAKASRFLHGTGETDTVRTADMVEKIGRVVSAIPEDGFGTVSISVGGHLTRLNARSSVAVPAGTEVSVTQVISPTAVQVEPLFLP
jgi:membrane protein implicated in regulation of membrane protease activity